MKNNKGMTLVSLILGIIFIVILTIVAIIFTLYDVKISLNMDKISEIKNKEKQEIYKKVSSVVLYNEDGTIDVSKTYLNVDNMFSDEELELVYPKCLEEIKETVTFEVAGKNGIYTYTINECK